MARKILVMIDEDYVVVKKHNNIARYETLSDEKDYKKAGFTQGVVYQVSDKPFTSDEPGMVLTKDDSKVSWGNWGIYYIVPGKRNGLCFCEHRLKDYFVNVPEKLYVREVWD